MCNSSEELYDLIDQGEGLSAYIPSNPKTVYASQGTLISWDDDVFPHPGLGLAGQGIMASVPSSPFMQQCCNNVPLLSS